MQRKVVATQIEFNFYLRLKIHGFLIRMLDLKGSEGICILRYCLRKVVKEKSQLWYYLLPRVVCFCSDRKIQDDPAVKTLTGEAEMSIPKGCQPDSKLVMRGKGIPYLQNRGGRSGRSQRKGNQIVHLKIEVPKTITPRQEELLREFDKEAEASGKGISGRLAQAAGSAFESFFGSKKSKEKDEEKKEKEGDDEKKEKSSKSDDSDKDGEDGKKQQAQ